MVMKPEPIFLVRNVPHLRREARLNAVLHPNPSSRVEKRRQHHGHRLGYPINLIDPPHPSEKPRSSPQKSKQRPKQQPKKPKLPPSPLKLFSSDVGDPLSGKIYRKMIELEFSVLGSDRGRSLLRLLGLEDFCFRPVPRLEKNLCDQFLATFNLRTSCGTVRGRKIKLDRFSVAAATSLPLGSAGAEAEIRAAETAEDKSALKRLLLASNDKRKNKKLGHHLRQLVFGAEGEVVMKVAAMIMVKLHCRRTCLHYVPSEVILALDRSMRWEVEMDWAGYLTQLMVNAVKGARKGWTFAFGEWLSSVIANALGDEVGGVHVEGSSSGPVTVKGEMVKVGDEDGIEEVVKLRKMVDDGANLISLLLLERSRMVGLLSGAA